MKKKRTLITVGAMILLLSVVTYAYYTAGINNDRAQTAQLSTGTLSLTLADGDNGIAAVLNFGSTITKKFTLQNTGSLDASASISWFNLVNTYLAGSLMYELEYSETLDGEYEPVVSNLMVPTSEEPITTPLVTQVTVPVGKTYYYNLNITLVNSEVIDQTSDINASFHSQFTISDASSLSASEQTLANLGLVVSNGTPDFTKAAGTAYHDNGFSSEEKTYTMRSWEDGDDTIYYSETYTLDESTGKYSLVNPQSGKYKEVYNNLKNVYINYSWSFSSTTNIPTIYKITSASYDASTNKGNWTYLIPNDNTIPDYSTTGIYEMEDDYGTSYYFRGYSENNYVKLGKWANNVSVNYYASDLGIFYDTLEECLNVSEVEYCTKIDNAGKDMYWRIVRINGDGSLRIVYDGTKAYKNGEWSGDKLIDVDDRDYHGLVGYMLGIEADIEDGGVCYIDGKIDESITNPTECKNSGVCYVNGKIDESITDEYNCTNNGVCYVDGKADESIVDWQCGDIGKCYIDGTLREDINYSGYCGPMGTCIIEGETFDETTEELCYEFGGDEWEQTPNSTYTWEEIPNEWEEIPSEWKSGEWIIPDSNRCLKLVNGVVTDTISENSTKTQCESSGGKWTTNAYEATFANVADSPLKTAVDNWYTLNISNLGEYISDTLFCSDRSIGNNAIFGYEDIEFGAYSRIKNNSPQLKCVQKNDRFTVSDIKQGNGDLTYPVGLLSADEMILMGAKYNASNSYFPLAHTSSMSPANYSEGLGFMITMYNSGIFGEEFFGDFIVEATPVINIKPEYVAEMIGDGTIGNEFRVE